MGWYGVGRSPVASSFTIAVAVFAEPRWQIALSRLDAYLTRLGDCAILAERDLIRVVATPAPRAPLRIDTAGVTEPTLEQHERMLGLSRNRNEHPRQSFASRQ